MEEKKNIKELTGASLEEWDNIVNNKLSKEDEEAFADSGKELKDFGKNIIKEKLKKIKEKRKNS